MKKNKDLLKYKEKGAGKGDLTIEAKKLRMHMVEMVEAEYGDDEVDPTTDKPYIDGVPTTQGLQKSFSKILPKMLAAMEDKLALGVKGMSSKEKAFFKDRDIAEVYRDSIRRRASRQINASERSAMIRLAATLPVGSPERKIILAGCEKMKSPAMVQNCEDMKAGKKPGKGKSKAKSDDKKDDGKMPADLLEKFKAKKAGKTIGKGKNGYIAMYKRKQVDVMADTQLEARDLAAKHFRARKPYEVNVMLATKDVNPVTHMPMFASKKELPEALKKNQFTSEDNPNPKGNDKDGDGKTNEPSPVPKKARVKSKRESMGMMHDLRKKHGDRTKAYYQAVIDEVKAGVIAPSAVVGGGYKNGKKVAIEWLEGQMKGKKGALVRLAATLPVGSDERKTILRLASE